MEKTLSISKAISEDMKKLEYKHDEINKIEDIPHLSRVYKKFNSFIYDKASKCLMSPFGEVFCGFDFDEIIKIKDYDGKIIYEKPKEEWKEIKKGELFELTEVTIVRLDGKKYKYCSVVKTCEDCKRSIKGHCCEDLKDFDILEYLYDVHDVEKIEVKING
jgi:hypothetical protein